MTAPLLEVQDLATRFATPGGTVHAVDGVSFTVAAGETVAVVGESGSGKSVMARSLMGIEQDRPSATVTGSSRFEGRDLIGLPVAARRKVWGAEIGMVQQNPMAALSPVVRIGDQLTEVLKVHRGLRRREARERAAELLAQVRIPSPAERLGQYPHELSGGMRQRVCVALAIACEPKLLVADEPTTALDVTVQRQVLDLLADLTGRLDMATVLITHHLGVASRYADRILVMYAGRIIEELDAGALVTDAEHPYTQALMRSVPRLHDRLERLDAIEGRPPDLRNLPAGCRFAPRCPQVHDRCRVEHPRRTVDDAGHAVACHLRREGAA